MNVVATHPAGRGDLNYEQNKLIHRDFGDDSDKITRRRHPAAHGLAGHAAARRIDETFCFA